MNKHVALTPGILPWRPAALRPPCARTPLRGFPTPRSRPPRQSLPPATTRRSVISLVQSVTPWHGLITALARPGHVQPSLTWVVRAAWARQASSTPTRNTKKQDLGDEPNTNSSQNKCNAPPQHTQTLHAPQTTVSPQSEEPHTPASDGNLPPPKPLRDLIPQTLPHRYRPTKAELLGAASGFWSRIKVHFKWLTIRSTRPFNADEIYALISWILAAHILWIVLGTTTFFMLTIFLINTAFSQEALGKWIGNYLTKSSGINVVFETAVVPKWRDGVISFRKVFLSRRPGQGRGKITKRSQATIAAAAAAVSLQEKDASEPLPEVKEPEEDSNYTQFDISIDTVNVTLSFSKWFNGKGLLKDVEIKGIRGVVDRTALRTIEGVDPKIYKHKHNPGDFELDSFKMEDLLVTVYQPNGFRPFSFSMFSCDLPQLRKQWLFYDFLSANMMSGSFDNSLFTVHPRQTNNYTGAQLSLGFDTEDGRTWKKHSRIRIDGLNIDHLNRGYEGPFSWIHEGNVDIVADIMLPNDEDDSIAKVMSDMYDRVEATVSYNGRKHHFSDYAAHEFDEHEGDDLETCSGEDDNRYIIMDMRVHLNDVRAAVPIFTRDISYVNNALVRPIVAYMNSRRTFIPVNCRVVKKVKEFDGSWTLYDSGLMEEVSREMYDAFARDVLDDRTIRKRRIKKVGIWTLQLAAQALFLGLAGNIA